MTVETATFISQLDATKPTATDPKSEGDDHLRLVKAVLKAQFPNFGAGAVNASNTALNYLTAALAGDAGGNVGAGVATPQAKVDVLGMVRASHPVNATFRGFEFGYPGTAQSYGSFSMELASGEVRSSAGYAGWGGYHTWYTNGIERARIDPSGNRLDVLQTNPPALTVNGQMSVNLTTNTNLRFSVRGTDGVTRSANLTLA